MNILTIILLCHNRPEYAVKAIESILNQSTTDFDFIISDNSSNYHLKHIVSTYFPFLTYKSWFPGISAIEHFQAAFSSVKTPYFVVFHDDDLMEPHYVQSVLNQFSLTPYAAAVATNATRINSLGVPLSYRLPRNQYVFTSPAKYHLSRKVQICPTIPCR